MTVLHRRKALSTLAILMGLMTLATFCPSPALAASAGGGTGLPWESGLDLITRAIQGPVAYSFSLIGIVACGGALIFGAEIGEFLRRLIMLVLVVSLIVFASNFLNTLSSGGVAI